MWSQSPETLPCFDVAVELAPPVVPLEDGQPDFCVPFQRCPSLL
jgi:hypothetical protein